MNNDTLKDQKQIQFNKYLPFAFLSENAHFFYCEFINIEELRAPLFLIMSRVEKFLDENPQGRSLNINLENLKNTQDLYYLLKLEERKFIEVIYFLCNFSTTLDEALECLRYNLFSLDEYPKLYHSQNCFNLDFKNPLKCLYYIELYMNGSEGESVNSRFKLINNYESIYLDTNELYSDPDSNTVITVLNIAKGFIKNNVEDLLRELTLQEILSIRYSERLKRRTLIELIDFLKKSDTKFNVGHDYNIYLTLEKSPYKNKYESFVNIICLAILSNGNRILESDRKLLISELEFSQSNTDDLSHFILLTRYCLTIAGLANTVYIYKHLVKENLNIEDNILRFISFYKKHQVPANIAINLIELDA